MTTIMDVIVDENARFPIKDPYLEHQLDLVWVSRSKREVRPVCNCGWAGTARRPEQDMAVFMEVAEYESHLPR